MPIYTKLRYIKDGEGYIRPYRFTLNKEYECIGLHKTSYILRDDSYKIVYVSGRMRKRFFKGII